MKSILFILFFLSFITANAQNEFHSTLNDSSLILSNTFSNYNLGDTVYFNYKNGFVSKSQESKYNNKQCQSFGVISEKNNDKYLIKVKLIESCDKNGIVAYDSRHLFTKNRSTCKSEKLKRPMNVYMRVGQELWFSLKDWSK